MSISRARQLVAVLVLVSIPTVIVPAQQPKQNPAEKPRKIKREPKKAYVEWIKDHDLILTEPERDAWKKLDNDEAPAGVHNTLGPKFLILWPRQFVHFCLEGIAEFDQFLQVGFRFLVFCHVHNRWISEHLVTDEGSQSVIHLDYKCFDVRWQRIRLQFLFMIFRLSSLSFGHRMEQILLQPGPALVHDRGIR